MERGQQHPVRVVNRPLDWDDACSIEYKHPKWVVLVTCSPCWLVLVFPDLPMGNSDPDLPVRFQARTEPIALVKPFGLSQNSEHLQETPVVFSPKLGCRCPCKLMSCSLLGHGSGWRPPELPAGCALGSLAGGWSMVGHIEKWTIVGKISAGYRTKNVHKAFK